MHFNGPFKLEDIAEREWLITNGLGGYASSTLCGMNTRRYHGLLVAALHPPGARTLLVAKLEEVLSYEGNEYAISTNQYPDVYYPGGYRFLSEFDYCDDHVTFTFDVGPVKIEKRVSMISGENTTLVSYRNVGNKAFSLSLTPLVNGRDFHGETAAESIDFSIETFSTEATPRINIKPAWMNDGYWINADAGRWQDERPWNRNMFYSWEERRGLTAYDNHFSPGKFLVELGPGEEVTITLSTTNAHSYNNSNLKSRPCPPNTKILIDDPLEIQHLRRTAETFLVKRDDGRTVIAGYHWFGDWGRDTMIALPGLCFPIGRYADAAKILKTFAGALHRGLLPNLFLDSGEGAAYNAVDASLWYVYAVDSYYRATANEELLKELRPALEEIIRCYREGTDFGIGMDDDGLINTTAPGWQLTWMDAKVGDWVVTPRMGKPVEINALWYNALRVMESYAGKFGWNDEYSNLAALVRKNFEAYWNPERQCLYDVLGDTPDRRIRPNQIFAVSLPYSPLGLDRSRAVVKAVDRHLLTPYGLRTLSSEDPEYRGHYGGGQWERDGAYHQGTVWAWLMGPYLDAYQRVNEDTEKAKAACRKLLQPLLAHVREAGVGSISEIFDGDPPHTPQGTISQAWSVAEVLRLWDKCRPQG